jgi:hypothetical protein
MYLSKILRHIFLDRPNSISLVLRFNILILVLRILIVLSIVVKRIWKLYIVEFARYKLE